MRDGESHREMKIDGKKQTNKENHRETEIENGRLGKKQRDRERRKEMERPGGTGQRRVIKNNS